MRKAQNIPKASGVYALVTLETLTGKPDGSRAAYVGWCANLQQRANMWEYRFRKKAKNPKEKLPVRNMPDLPSEAWAFLTWPGLDKAAGIETTRAALTNAGFTIINEKSRVREEVEWRGKVATIAEHARAAGVPYSKAYYRYKAGMPLDVVFDPAR